MKGEREREREREERGGLEEKGGERRARSSETLRIVPKSTNGTMERRLCETNNREKFSVVRSILQM